MLQGLAKPGDTVNNPDYDIYKAFKAHLNLGDSIESMDVYTAWAVWKTAYTAGYEATLKDDPRPCEA